jgi:hypothetical protein
MFKHKTYKFATFLQMNDPEAKQTLSSATITTMTIFGEEESWENSEVTDEELMEIPMDK